MDNNDGKCFDFCWWWRKSPPSASEPSSFSLPKAPSINAEAYNMEHPRRGRALIFTHDTFKSSSSNRNGAKIDEKSISKHFEDLSFEVEVFPNLKKIQVLSKLDEVANYDHRDCDCLAVVVMSHGNSNKLWASDSSYNKSKLWEAFTAEKCPTLAGKPKLFFIQACRGKGYDNGVRVCVDTRTETDGGRATYTIPAMADILIVNATFDGYYAWRSGKTGTWFIQELGKCLERYSETKEICQILTIVNRRVAITYESCVPDDLKAHKKKQMPNYLSTLTRELYLKKKPGCSPKTDP